MTQKRYNNRYIGRVRIGGWIVNVGTFDNRPRALIAEKLARYWHSKGFEVPAQPRMVDAI